jgi:hypothetical protein
MIVDSPINHKFDIILHNVRGGPILRKCKHPAPPVDDIDLCIQSHYDKACHGKKLRSKLDLSRLDKTVRNQVYLLIQKYWLVFDDKGQSILVKDYQCSINI